MDEERREKLLHDVEEGRIDVEEAIRHLEADEPAPDKGDAIGETEPQTLPAKWRQWWWIPFSVGVAIAAAGYGLSTLGGWWWICAGPAWFVGVVLMLLMLMSSRSPWVHIRVHTGEEEWPRNIALSVPLPLRPVAWFLRVFGSYFKQFDATGLDEILLAVNDQFDGKTPLTVHVDEGENGERVDIVLG